LPAASSGQCSTGRSRSRPSSIPSRTSEVCVCLKLCFNVVLQFVPDGRCPDHLSESASALVAVCLRPLGRARLPSKPTALEVKSPSSPAGCLIPSNDMADVRLGSRASQFSVRVSVSSGYLTISSLFVNWLSNLFRSEQATQWCDSLAQS
jgi:hypothetical protein